ncbi:MAG: hypothetical protein ACM3VT_08170, partial [Solirubrobacterales bacterium]
MAGTNHYSGRCIAHLVCGLSLSLFCGWLPITNAEDVPQNKNFTKVPYPRIAMLWASIRGDDSLEAMARHDLIMAGFGRFGLKLDREPKGLADGFTPESVAAAKERIAKLRSLNPDAVILGDLPFYEYPDDWLPEDHAWWLRKDGKRQQFWPGTHRMDWGNEQYRQHVV